MKEAQVQSWTLDEKQQRINYTHVLGTTVIMLSRTLSRARHPAYYRSQLGNSLLNVHLKKQTDSHRLSISVSLLRHMTGKFLRVSTTLKSCFMVLGEGVSKTNSAKNWNILSSELIRTLNSSFH